MNNNNNLFKLIDGEFTPAEAKEVLLSLIEYKIQFHNLKIFGSKEKYGVANEQSVERVKQLRETKDRIIQFMEEVGDEHTSLVIESTIKVESKKLAETAK